MLMQEVFISELFPIDRFTTHSIKLSEISSLQHKLRDNYMKYRSLEVKFLSWLTNSLFTSTQTPEILGCFWGILKKQEFYLSSFYTIYRDIKKYICLAVFFTSIQILFQYFLLLNFFRLIGFLFSLASWSFSISFVLMLFLPHPFFLTNLLSPTTSSPLLLPSSPPL